MDYNAFDRRGMVDTKYYKTLMGRCGGILKMDKMHKWLSTHYGYIIAVLVFYLINIIVYNYHLEKDNIILQQKFNVEIKDFIHTELQGKIVIYDYK